MVVRAENGSLIEDVNGIRNEVLLAFEGRFKEPMSRRPKLNNSGFMCLLEEDSSMLEAEFLK